MKERPSFVRVVTVTPEDAIELLDTNYEGQRRVKRTNVAKLVEVMKAGKWDPYVGDLIRVTRDGILVDGQHRLTAVIEAETPCDFLYADCFDVEDFPFIDTGLSRAASDVIGSRCDPRLTASLVRMVMNWEDGGIESPCLFLTPRSNGTITEKYGEMPEAVEDAVRKGTAIYKGLEIRGSKASACLFAYLAEAVSRERLDAFLESSKDDERMTGARTFFLRAAASGKKLTPTEILSMLTTMWNDGITGRDRKAYRPNTRRIEMYGVNKRWNNVWLERENELGRMSR